MGKRLVDAFARRAGEKRGQKTMMARQEMIFARSCFRRLVLIALIARTRAEVEFSCAPSLIANSNRSVTSSACTGSDGDECLFACNVGFVHVGRHVCQTISVQGATVVNQTFFGGRCDPLCEPATPCNDSAVPVRYRANASAPCLSTLCAASSDAALKLLARGAYEVFARGRHPDTGFYMDHVDPARFGGNAQPEPRYVSADSSGVGVAAEAVAAALGFIDAPTARRRVVTTLRAMAGRLPGVQVARNTFGFLPTFFDGQNGSSFYPVSNTSGPNVFSTDSTAFFTVGMLFARRYLVEGTDPAHDDPATSELAALADELLDAVSFDRPFCDTLVGVASEAESVANGTLVPWLVNGTTGCSDSFGPAPDGLYDFSEMHWYAWLVRERSGRATGGAEPAAAAFYDAWQGRASAPNFWYGGQALLTLWPSYVVQLPFYLVHPFNSDPTGRFPALLRAQWQAEWAYFNSSSLNAGEGGRYGLGAGPTEAWCSGTTYKADLLSNDTSGEEQTCRMYSPYAVAGYLPADPGTIQQHLLALLRTGEAVYPLSEPSPSQQQLFVLWRKSLLDPSWSLGYGITLVDFAAELFGLSTLWLGTDFYARNTNHWPN